MIKFGDYPNLECSSQGDKRFSPFFARIKSRGNKSIEEIYQSSKIFKDGTNGNEDWKLNKGKKPVNLLEVRLLYSQLWNEYIDENPELIEVLKSYPGLSDKFGSDNGACQAVELWRIRNKAMNV